MILEKNSDYVEYVTSENQFDFVKGEIQGKNQYSIKYKYQGQISKENQKPCGIGRAIMEDNTIHEGLFYNGQMNGFGRSFYPDGTYYVGTYRNGKKEGEGRCSSFSLVEENCEYSNGHKRDPEYWKKIK